MVWASVVAVKGVSGSHVAPLRQIAEGNCGWRVIWRCSGLVFLAGLLWMRRSSIEASQVTIVVVRCCGILVGGEGWYLISPSIFGKWSFFVRDIKSWRAISRSFCSRVWSWRWMSLPWSDSRFWRVISGCCRNSRMLS